LFPAGNAGKAPACRHPRSPRSSRCRPSYAACCRGSARASRCCATDRVLSTSAGARHGDTFVVDAFGYRLFCVFSPAGVRALYALPERLASKGFRRLLAPPAQAPRRALLGPAELPPHLFGGQEVETYLDNVEAAVGRELDALGARGRFEIFAFTRRLGHRVGLASWGGIDGAAAHELDRLIPHFEVLDASESFVHPARGFLTWASDKRRERAAMTAIEAIYVEVLRAAPRTAPWRATSSIASWRRGPRPRPTSARPASPATSC
jgi:hypothetical protein